LEKVKKFTAGAAKSAAVDVLRGFMARQVRKIDVDKMIEAIEKDDTDLIDKLTPKQLKLFRAVARRFGKYVDLLTVKNVMLWLIEDAPFHAGVIYGHPKGLKWLSKILEQIRDEVQSYLQSLPPPQPSLELEPVEKSKTPPRLET
jgi:hypothetical protein